MQASTCTHMQQHFRLYDTLLLHMKGAQLNSQLECCRSCNAAVTKRFKGDFGMWKRRPIPQDLLQYAADDVAQLPLLADKLTLDMGKAQLQLLARLSAAWSQSMWSASDKEFSKGYGSIHAFPSTGSWLMQVFAVAKQEL